VYTIVAIIKCTALWLN